MTPPPPMSYLPPNSLPQTEMSMLIINVHYVQTQLICMCILYFNQKVRTRLSVGQRTIVQLKNKNNLAYEKVD